MLHYKSNLKLCARSLRKNQTRPELILWSYLRKKQILGILFGRQKPIGPYIVDFYAHAAKLVIELDGIQHYRDDHQEADIKRDRFLRARGLEVLRFNNLEILFNLEAVLKVIECKITGKPYTYVHGKFIELW